jgi:uncharacterized protein YecE (DUF72 family)
MDPSICIGISGWTYKPWRGKFYPEGMRTSEELHYASRQFNSLEINGTFYRLQKPQTFVGWYKQTPDDFCFSVKANRYITHIKRAKDARKPVGHFLASGVLCLRDKLGPILWQFPPNSILKDNRYEEFFKLLPRTFGEALKLVEEENEFFPEFKDYVPELKKLRTRPLIHTFEFRHESFFNLTFLQTMAGYGHGLVVADSAGKWPYAEDVTANFVYARLHGYGKLYEGGYPLPVIKQWAKKVVAWTDGKKWPKPNTVGGLLGEGIRKDVYVYFDNDAKVEAPFNAKELVKQVDKILSRRSVVAMKKGA